MNERTGDLNDYAHQTQEALEKTAQLEKMVASIVAFLESKGDTVTEQQQHKDGFEFKTKQGNFFIPAYSFSIIIDHPELLIPDGIVWQEIDDINPRIKNRYFKGILKGGDNTRYLFRKDSNIPDRKIEHRAGFPMQESRNSAHLGEGKPIIVDEYISFRVPEHYATTPHGVIMEYLPQQTVPEFIKKLDSQDAERVLRAYEKLADFLFDNEKYTPFYIPFEPLDKYKMAERTVFVESFDTNTGHVQFIITDLKNRTDKVDWESAEK